MNAFCRRFWTLLAQAVLSEMKGHRPRADRAKSGSRSEPIWCVNLLYLSDADRIHGAIRPCVARHLLNYHQGRRRSGSHRQIFSIEARKCDEDCSSKEDCGQVHYPTAPLLALKIG